MATIFGGCHWMDYPDFVNARKNRPREAAFLFPRRPRVDSTGIDKDLLDLQKTAGRSLRPFGRFLPMAL